jgi:hypothetical protein
MPIHPSHDAREGWFFLLLKEFKKAIPAIGFLGIQGTPGICILVVPDLILL